MLTAVVGTNWGDEGKGRMVDLLSEKYNVVILTVVRFARTQAQGQRAQEQYVQKLSHLSHFQF